MSMLWFTRYYPETDPIRLDSIFAGQALVADAAEISRSVGAGIVAASVRPDNRDKLAPQLELGLDAFNGAGFVYWHSRAIDTRRPRRVGYISLNPDHDPGDEAVVPYRYDDDQETTLPRWTQISIHAVGLVLADFRRDPETRSDAIAWRER